MIKYSLICAEKHRFEIWFASAAAYESLKTSKMVTCAICGSVDVEKAIMAPSVRTHGANRKVETEDAGGAAAHPLSEPASDREKALAELRKKIESTSDYVGQDFAREARAIHEGDSPRRSIHGEANASEAKSLIEDGIPVLPLPFLSRRKTS
ncbi:DUF1178 family protein [Tropicimonas isoalkanivorans]|uniref:DUF1178 family protein n=1 Tax=Tropicimonas isoalkanivorans TaxID=441112 RepID=A0A1I1NJB9_9RHOB|nr:DUF1178 family protein [Tropicimonas isoalkanivorans]SFC97526.1 hypothetical protein SAMN04488094_11296 [Tropicimonas isoalkanivorans]